MCTHVHNHGRTGLPALLVAQNCGHRCTVHVCALCMGVQACAKSRVCGTASFIWWRKHVYKGVPCMRVHTNSISNVLRVSWYKDRRWCTHVCTHYLSRFGSFECRGILSQIMRLTQVDGELSSAAHLADALQSTRVQKPLSFVLYPCELNSSIEVL